MIKIKQTSKEQKLLYDIRKEYNSDFEEIEKILLYKKTYIRNIYICLIQIKMSGFFSYSSYTCYYPNINRIFLSEQELKYLADESNKLLDQYTKIKLLNLKPEEFDKLLEKIQQKI